MNLKGCFSHKSDIWETPKDIYEYFMKRDYFDPCPINPKFNGLEIDWKERNFVNPPYSELNKWVNKAISERHKGHLVVMLIPARTDTKAFRNLYDSGASFMFITGRLRFSQKNSAPFPSVLVVLGDSEQEFGFIDKDYFLWR